MATKAEKIAELKADLLEVRATISKARSSQEYGISGRNIKRVNYDSLLAEKKDLEGQIERLEGVSYTIDIGYDNLVPGV